MENGAVKLSAKETKCTSLEVRTHPTFLETLISKRDSGPVKLPGLSRNGPLIRSTNHSSSIHKVGSHKVERFSHIYCKNRRNSLLL